MKNVRNVLAAVAFVFAVGAAFASNSLIEDTVTYQKDGIPFSTCEITTLPAECSFVGVELCEIETSETNPYYYMSTSPFIECVKRLKKLEE